MARQITHLNEAATGLGVVNRTIGVIERGLARGLALQNEYSTIKVPVELEKTLVDAITHYERTVKEIAARKKED